MKKILFFNLLTLFFVACTSSKHKVVKYKDQSQNDILLHAAAKDTRKEVEEIIKKGANPEALDEFGATPLLQASLNGNLDIVKYLIEEVKVNRQATDFENANAVFMASYGGHLNLIKYLLKKLVKNNVPDTNGLTPFLISSYKGYPEIVKYFISLNLTVLKQSSYRGANALILASMGGNEETIEYLLKKGMNVNYRDKYGLTPLILASSSANPSTLYILLKNKSNINDQSSNGTTALLEAVRSGRIENVKFLLKNKADPNIGFYVSQTKTRKILSTLDLAMLLKRKDIIKLLKLHNALNYDEIDKLRDLPKNE